MRRINKGIIAILLRRKHPIWISHYKKDLLLYR
jgi:hypothetical protein